MISARARIARAASRTRHRRANRIYLIQDLWSSRSSIWVKNHDLEIGACSSLPTHKYQDFVLLNYVLTMAGIHLFSAMKLEAFLSHSSSHLTLDSHSTKCVVPVHIPPYLMCGTDFFSATNPWNKSEDSHSENVKHPILYTFLYTILELWLHENRKWLHVWCANVNPLRVSVNEFFLLSLPPTRFERFASS